MSEHAPVVDKAEKHFKMDNIFKGLNNCLSVYNDALTRLDLNHRIDEVAYLFPDRHHLDLFTREAVQVDGCIMFNTADDHVHTLPLRTCYDVEYRFFTVPVEYQVNALETVRIEAMRLGRGFSPLHEAETFGFHQAPPCLAIHASFKCQTEEEYAAVVHRLRDRGWEVAQKCDSTYGRFSYWTPLDRDEWTPDGPFVYLKPRVNTRDGGVHDD